MFDRIRSYLYPAAVFVMLGTLWAVAEARSLSDRAGQRYWPALPTDTANSEIAPIPDHLASLPTHE